MAPLCGGVPRAQLVLGKEFTMRVDIGHSCRSPSAQVAAGYAEDCLFLNVYAPTLGGHAHAADYVSSAGPKAPVMVILHGGDNVRSCSDEVDPSAWVEAGDVVAITLNHRLQALGFLGSDRLPRAARSSVTGRRTATAGEDASAGSWNFALLDQRLALRWVADNIAAFEGDRQRITLVGHSSGGAAVLAHMAMPRSSGLFHRAIIESALPLVPEVAVPTAIAEAQLDGLLQATACGSVECLLDLSAEEISRSAPSARSGWRGGAAGFPWILVIDGEDLVGDPVALAEAGHLAGDIAVVLGTTRDEMAAGLAIEGLLDPANESEFLVTLAAWGAPTLPDAAALYSPQHVPYPQRRDRHGDFWWRAVFALTDWFFVCPTRRLAQALVKANPAGTFVYSFEYAVESERTGLPPGYGEAVYHSAEVPFVFNCPASAGNCTCSTAHGEKALADSMATYWKSFAADGRPSGPTNLPVWPASGPSGDTVLVIDVPVEFAGGGIWTRSTGVRQQSDLCERWDQARESRRTA
eukprot:CAMPEP_0117463890 /NCGR_PEP_ID=MMETSP0784-20121206/3816_1 /TAXON_ID=39447 /ORGANISM="" /LENGTH=522 /DNA_ID=CAMNT_0005257727 /DNA_START=1 /DNA_END=1566 /DNA_ORIENTATION=+